MVGRALVAGLEGLQAVMADVAAPVRAVVVDKQLAY